LDKSTHRVDVVEVHLEKHPNADSLSIVKVFGYTVCVRTSDWRDSMLGAYIPPDSIVPNTPMFSFLGEHRRIKVKKLRGIVSMGLLMPAPEGAKVGDNVAEQMGVTHYDPPVNASTGGNNCHPPEGFHPVYDVDSWRRYKHLFHEGEEIVATEKIHGANGRWVFINNEMFSGSHTGWKKYDPKILWWSALAQNPWIEAFCKTHPGVTLYGEVYGQVQDLKYGTVPGSYKVRIFDIMTLGNWWPYADVVKEAERSALELVPLVFRGPYNAVEMEKMSDGPSLIPGANHLREGIVVKPMVERTDPEIGRVQLKIVSNQYLERT